MAISEGNLFKVNFYYSTDHINVLIIIINLNDGVGEFYRIKDDGFGTHLQPTPLLSARMALISTLTHSNVNNILPLQIWLATRSAPVAYHTEVLEVDLSKLEQQQREPWYARSRSTAAVDCGHLPFSG